MKSIKQNIRDIYSNIRGWRTDRKIVVIESDDWGSVRMPSKEVYNYCLSKGYNVDKNIYTKYDSLESEDDLESLTNLLSNFRDIKGKNPIITINFLSANPDFEKIKESGYKEYHYELITETYNKYNKRNWEIWKKAISEKYFVPQSHGREHLNVPRFMSGLKSNDTDLKFAVDLGMPGIFKRGYERNGNQYIVPFEYYDASDKEEMLRILRDGLELFEKLFQYKSKSFIFGNYIWDEAFEKVLYDNEVKCLQGGVYQLLPKGNYSGTKKRKHYLGQWNKQNQLYLVRNVIFEPSSNRAIDWVDRALSQISTIFSLKKPAIICTHRVNYIGFLDIINRDLSLSNLERLLKEITARWPSIEFMSTVDLYNLITEGS